MKDALGAIKMTTTPALLPGMGSIPHEKGCVFRVWAPHAEAVFVTGSFNDWAETNHPLQRDGDIWEANIEAARLGDEYRYLIQNGGQLLSRNDPYAREVSNSVGNSIVHDRNFDWGEDAFYPPPLNEMVIYEMHVGTFRRESADAPGTFDTAIPGLSYLRELGVNAIEIMPVAEFAGGFSWGYNPAHIFAVESEYGGPLALKRFVKAAHEQGIAVILDVVYNHFGPSDLDLWKFDGWSENDLGGIYFYNDARAKTPWGDTRPDYGRPEVRQFIRDNALMWLEEYRVDGLRFDSVSNIRSINGDTNNPEHDLPDGWSLLQWMNSEIKQRFPLAFTIAEDLHLNSFLTKLPEEGGAGFNAQWDPRFIHSVRPAITAMEDAHRDLDAVADAVLHRYNTDSFERVVYTESHDDVAEGDVRVPEQLAPGDAGNWLAKKRSTLGAVLVFTSPGIPMIFQGQEFLEDRWFDDQIPLDWSKKERHMGIFRLYADLIRLRLNCNDATRGLTGHDAAIIHNHQESKVIAYHRWAEGGGADDVLVILNFSQQTMEHYSLEFPFAGTWRVRFNSDSDAYDAGFGNMGTVEIVAAVAQENGPAIGQVDLGPYSAIILSM